MTMNRTGKTGMAAAMVLLAMSMGTAMADSVRHRGSDSVLIKFDEPVVSTGIVENGYNEHATPEQRGLDLFDITGDPQHQPKARWTDQDKLLITFEPGTATATKYRLAFRPGVDKYLGGKQMPEPAFEFSPKAQALDIAALNPGIAGGAVCVCSRNALTREQQNFSTDSAVRYEFREVLKGNSLTYGKTVPAKASQALIKHLPPQKVAELLRSPEKLGLKADEEGLKGFHEELPVPGYVLVTPTEALDSAKTWDVHAVAEEASGFVSGRLDRLTIEKELGTHAGFYTTEKAGKVTLCGAIRFSAPVLEAKLTDIFREVDIRVGDAVATTAEDGKSKTLQLNGKTITFRLQEPDANVCNIYSRNGDTRVGYDAPYTNILRFEVEGTEELPVTPDIIIKAGTQAMLGQSTACDHCHRYTVNGMQPVLSFDTPLNSPALLPLKGEHKVLMESINNSKLHVSVARLSAEQYLQHHGKLSLKAEDAEKQLAQLTYNLALLEKRIATGLENEKEQKDVIKNLKRDIAKLKTSVPDFAALRTKLEGVEFSAEQVLDVSATGDALMGYAHTALDLDALSGGSAPAGFYIIAIRSEAAPAVRAALSALGLPEDLMDFETWSSVQLTDLNLINTDKAFILHKLSDGSQLTEGKVLLLNGGGKELATVTDGVAVMPAIPNSGRKTPQLMLQCGDDFRTVYWRGDAPRLETDRRIMTVLDRPLYRPGDTVHMRGVLRSVSPLGEPALPKVSQVEVIVSRPNRKEFIRKNIKLNEFGAFDISFDLPKGDEDVVGTYRISIQADGNKYRDEEYVNCEEFRRDAFTAKGELKVEPVRPQEFTYTISAQDLNSVPLSGAKAELEFTLSYDYNENNCPPGCKQVKPHLKPREWSESVTLGEDGTYTYTGKFDYLHTDALMNGNWSLHVSGAVVNDREEPIKLNRSRETMYPADFSAVTNFNEDMLTLYSNVNKDAKNARPILDREQTVHLRLLTQQQTRTTLPNNLVLSKEEPTTVWEGDLTVPANAANGAPMGLKEIRRKYQESLSKEETAGDSRFILEISGKDAAGREFITQRPMHWYDTRVDAPNRLDRDLTCKVEERTVQVKSHFENEGQATVMLISVAGARAAKSVTVQKGENTWNIPLTDEEYGNVNVAVMLPLARNGQYTALETATGSAEVERVEYKLATELNMPSQHPTPGTEITLSGTVLGPDGKPVPAAQVTLFAVDEGMLSAGGGYSIDNPGTFFTNVWVHGIYPRHEQLPLAMKPSEAKFRSQLLQGLWQGEIVGEGTLLRNRNYPYESVDMVHAPRNAMALGAAPRATKRAAYAVDRAEVVACESASFDACSPMVEECAAPAAPAPEPEAGHWGVDAETEGETTTAGSGEVAPPAPRLRTNFVPVAIWAPALPVDAEGKFSVQVKLPDTLTTYQVYAIALGADGKSFGHAENKFTVSQPVMLTPGTPLFMSVSDRLRLPLTITNNTDSDGTWNVQLEGAEAPQQVTLKAKSTSTLYFDYTATEEGERKLHWVATAAAGSDAVEGVFEVKFPAPVLRESHRLVLDEGSEPLKVAALAAPELASSTRASIELQLSANPLLHLNECMELTLSTGYGCTERYATSLLPWLLYDRMAPFSPTMAATPAEEARKIVLTGIERLVKCQRKDGGMGFWPSGCYCTCNTSSPWASAYAGLVLTIAKDRGYSVPENTMQRLRGYLSNYIKEMRKDADVWKAMSPHILYACGRTLGDDALITDALKRAMEQNTLREQLAADYCEPFHPGACCLPWFHSTRSNASLVFLANMHRNKATSHESFLKWMRVVGHDYRHATGWDGGWMLIALHEYLRLTPAGNPQATVTLQDGSQLTLGNGITAITPAKPATLAELPTVITRTQGTVYVSAKFKAQPEQTDYPGVTEKGLQVTRIYECRNEQGAWVPCTDFKVGDVVRVTLTCAKAEKDLEYFVLEDYLPSNLEAINPRVPSQAAGLEWQPWSHWFDNREFQSHRVRGFCTRWAGRDLLNMSYYARVRRAGSATAPPASAQLMYEPQTYGLSPNTKVISK